MDELRRLQQAFHGAGVQPGKAPAQQLHIQNVLLQVHAVQGGDFQFPPLGRAYLFGASRNPGRVEVQAGNGVVALGLGRLFLQRDDLLAFVEFHHAEPLRVGDIVAEDGGAAVFRVRPGIAQNAGEAAAIENVVPQHHGAGRIADEFLADEEGLSKTIRAGLDGIAQVNAKVAAVSQKLPEAGGIRGGGNNQNVPNSRQHQCGQGIVDHRFVVYREQLLGGDLCQRIQPGAGAAGQNDTLHM